VKRSNNVELKNNMIYNFRPIAISIDYAENITVDGNVVGHVVDRTTVEGFNFIDKAAVFAICSFFPN
jgi:hypothetical protein